MEEDFYTKSFVKGTGCYSNGGQLSSGASGGDVQSGAIGYYEAWAHGRKCSGMVSDSDIFASGRA